MADRGSFGPEASIVALPVIAGVAIFVWYHYKRTGAIEH